MAQETIENRLQEIWSQGHRSMAAAFLRRALTLDSTLAEVAATLQFDAVRDFLEQIKLRDVLQHPASGRPAATAALPVPRAAAPVIQRQKRRRRGPSEMKEIKDEVQRMLDREPGSLDTTQMYESLSKDGHELDRITLNRLLAQLASEKTVVCLGGRPKSWRAVSRPSQQKHS